MGTVYVNSFTVILVLISVYNSNGFNLSPKPNIVLREPIGDGIPKMRSSYFGFSLNLKRNSVLVGAPRAQSTIDKQRNINETGAIYKCSFDQNKSNKCAPFVFDSFGNGEETNNQYTYNNEMKDYQWLGASIDGGSNDNEKTVVCAPRMISNQSVHYLFHGVCYWTQDTSTNEPMNVQKIALLRLREKQSYKASDDLTHFYYMYGEQGLSVHVTDNNEEILIGAPGVSMWKGSVIRHKAKPMFDLGDLSRRSDDATSFPRQRTTQEMLEYSSDIPNPLFWNQDDNSYFGFAVSSGYFDGIGKTKLLYVASAPQANLQQGAVYIFDIVDHFSGSDKTIKIYYTFPGQQLGEYFGYSLITEDFDGDGLTDIAIGAPYNSKTGDYENGAVHIYRNEGFLSNFMLHAVLQTEYELSGRFGTTLSKVGDINQDGFNDLMVGAPFEENGVVYIYHGGLNGLPIEPSQRIAAPSNAFVSDSMFGHGLSKGADIDNNHYLDIAVGSPNSEAVYIYKSYPVIRINTSITPFSQEIQTTDKTFKFEVCWSFDSMHPIGFDLLFNATIRLDGQLGRAVFKDNRNEYKIDGNITSSAQCIMLESFISFSVADIFRPIELEMVQHVQNGIRSADANTGETQDICGTCVAINPNDAKSVRNKLVFSTGCKSARCIADLKIKSSSVNIPSLPYVLGSTSSLNIIYNVENAGETAYLPRIQVILPESNVLFTKIPSNCKLDFKHLMCDLNNGLPILRAGKTSFNISIDAASIEGNELIVKAKLFSAGDEDNESDNVIEDKIPLERFSNVEVIGESNKNRIILEDNNNELEKLTHIFEIRNNGPSNIKSLDISVSIPLSYLNPWTLKRESLIDISSISIKTMYNKQNFDVVWLQNDTIQTNGIELPVENNDNSLNNTFGPDRKRRFIGREGLYFNSYLQKVIDSPWARDQTILNDTEPIEYRNGKEIFSVNDYLLANLPINRTIYIDCQTIEKAYCLVGKFTVTNLKANDLPILITLNFAIDLKKVAKIMTEKKDVVVVRTSVDLIKTSDEDTSSIKITQNHPFTIISKYMIASMPIWIYILSIIIGILALILISYTMYKLGFFNRDQKDELNELKQQSRVMSVDTSENEEEFQ